MSSIHKLRRSQRLRADSGRAELVHAGILHVGLPDLQRRLPHKAWIGLDATAGREGRGKRGRRSFGHPQHPGAQYIRTRGIAW